MLALRTIVAAYKVFDTQSPGSSFSTYSLVTMIKAARSGALTQYGWTSKRYLIDVEFHSWGSGGTDCPVCGFPMNIDFELVECLRGNHIGVRQGNEVELLVPVEKE
jgi:hypothetical protein